MMRKRSIFKYFLWAGGLLALLSLHAYGKFAFLDEITIKLGKFQPSLLTALKTILLISILVWAALGLAKRCETRLKRFKHLQPSSQILFSKFIKILLIGAAIFSGFSILGIDISIFAFFAGALGLGIGFGLQNAFSNFFCGVTLLVDRSIKPGDVVAIDDGKIYGIVHRLNTRYVSIRTREGKEHLIPNEYFITNKVENWTYSDRLVRVPIKVKVAFDSDLVLVEKILNEVVSKVDRVLKKPKPSIRFKQIIENGVEIEIRIWIDDPENGISSVTSPINIGIWKAFKTHGIQIPYPPRELFFNRDSEKSSTLLEELNNRS